MFLFHFRCAPGYQGNPMLPNGKCVLSREYEFNNCTDIFEIHSFRHEIDRSCTWIVLAVVHFNHPLIGSPQGLTLCNDWQQDFPWCYSSTCSVWSQHRNAELLEHSQVHFALHMSSSLLCSLPAGPSTCDSRGTISSSSNPCSCKVRCRTATWNIRIKL